MDDLSALAQDPISVQIGTEMIDVAPLPLKQARHVISQTVELLNKFTELPTKDGENEQDQMLLQVVVQYTDDIIKIASLALPDKDSNYLESSASLPQMFRLIKAIIKVNEIGEVVSDFTGIVKRFMPKLTVSAPSSSSALPDSLAGPAEAIIQGELERRSAEPSSKETPSDPSMSSTTPAMIP